MSIKIRYSDRLREKYNEKDKNFVKWIDKIEDEVESRTGMKLLDLPDQPYRIMYEEGKKPNKVIKCIVDDFTMFLKSLE